MAGNWKNIEEQIDRARERARHGDPREKRGEKRSWRDIDAKRDGAAHGPHRDDERQQGKEPRIPLARDTTASLRSTWIACHGPMLAAH